MPGYMLQGTQNFQMRGPRPNNARRLQNFSGSQRGAGTQGIQRLQQVFLWVYF